MHSCTFFFLSSPSGWIVRLCSSSSRVHDFCDNVENNWDLWRPNAWQTMYSLHPAMLFWTSAFLFWVKCVVCWRINSLVAATARSTLLREAAFTLAGPRRIFCSAALLTHLLQVACILHRIRRPPRSYPPDNPKLTCFLHFLKRLSSFTDPFSLNDF